ncbi:MAG: hypothetical protein AB7K24_24310, partial [Gemmataceae bacterium]
MRKLKKLRAVAILLVTVSSLARAEPPPPAPVERGQETRVAPVDRHPELATLLERVKQTLPAGSRVAD